MRLKDGKPELDKLRASDGLNMGTFETGTRPVGLTYDGTHVWVANKMSNNVMKFLAKDGSLVATIAVGQSDGNRIRRLEYLGNQFLRQQCHSSASFGWSDFKYCCGCRWTRGSSIRQWLRMDRELREQFCGAS